MIKTTGVTGELESVHVRTDGGNGSDSTVTAVGPPEIAMNSELANRLVERLNEEELTYCHWKSNFSLARALSGELDLDFLVERETLPQMLTILANLGFKLAVDKVEPETPGISHFYGFDPQTEQMVHVHLFSCVLTGESFVKSHLLPFEPMLLENVAYVGQMKVTSRPAELVLFVLRTFIKYGSLLDLKYLIRSSDESRAELRWLRSGSDMSVALDLLERFCPVVDKTLFLKCMDALDSDSSTIRRVRLAQQVRSRLSIYARNGSIGRISAYVRLLWGEAWRRLLGNKRNRMLKSGGAVIAFVGPEATGKSTLVSSCERWLGDVFSVRTVHAGKPPSSWITAPVNVLLPMARCILPSLRTTRLEGQSYSGNSNQARRRVEGLPALPYAFMAVVLAWDRRRLLIKARRSAANGEIVICDRYPSDMVGAMDSPRLHKASSENGVLTNLYNRLARLERRLYEQIPAPDIVLKLEVSIETAIMRNRVRIKDGKESDAYVASRHRQFQEWRKFGTKHIYQLNTEQPLAKTVVDARKAIWGSL